MKLTRGNVASRGGFSAVTLSFDERSGKEAAGRRGKYELNGVFLMPAGTK